MSVAGWPVLSFMRFLRKKRNNSSGSTMFRELRRQHLPTNNWNIYLLIWLLIISVLCLIIFDMQELITEKEGCERVNDQCVMGKWMEAHADYIYTQDIKDPWSASKICFYLSVSVFASSSIKIWGVLSAVNHLCYVRVSSRFMFFFSLTMSVCVCVCVCKYIYSCLLTGYLFW